MKYWIKLSIIIGLPLLVVGFIFIYQGSPKEIVAVADQFQPDESWQLTTERIVPPAFTCLEANCPSVHRTWETGDNITKQEFQKVLNDSGWNFVIEDDCLPRANITGSGQTLCGAKGHIGDYQINVNAVGGNDSQSDGRIILSIEK